MMILCGFSRLDRNLTLLSQRILHPLSTMTLVKEGLWSSEVGAMFP